MHSSFGRILVYDSDEIFTESNGDTSGEWKQIVILEVQ